MDPATLVLVLALVFGFYMAWNIGANDVANAMGTSVGSEALTIRQAVVVAAVFEFGGAFLVGGHVTDTIRKGILDPGLYAGAPLELAVGMLSALLSAALWLQFATSKGLPVSTTHSIVGAVIGFAVVSMGATAVDWSRVLSIVSSWFVSPLCGGILGYLSYKTIQKTIFESEQRIPALKRVTPILMFLVGTVLGLILFFKGLKNLKLDLTLGQTSMIALFMGTSLAIGTFIVLRRLPGVPPSDEERMIEKVFSWLQILTACFMAFAHGSNDVANAIGPLAAVFSIVSTGAVTATATVPLWILGLGGVGIVIGLATYGSRVIETVGKNITEMTPTRGFAAEFGAALTILVGSRLGLPLSTTHVLVGAVIGVGMARGISALDKNVIRNVGTSWIVTVPAAALLCAFIFAVLHFVIL